jgi:hypothetical protein
MAKSDDEPLPSTALVDAEAAMHKGRAGSLVAMGGLGAALVAGLVFLMGGQDQARVYGEIGRQINGLKRGHFDQFWGCALQGANVNDIKSNAELETQVGGRGQERGQRYGVHVREKCLPKLVDIGPKLDTLIVPTDLQPDVNGLKQANAQLRSAFSAYVAYLDDPELDYDEERGDPLVKEIGKAWYDFKKAHADVNKLIKGKLQ